MLVMVFASWARSSEEETSSVMSWSTNWPKYVYPAGIVESGTSGGVGGLSSSPLPESPISPPSWASRASVVALNGSFEALRTAAENM